MVVTSVLVKRVVENVGEVLKASFRNVIGGLFYLMTAVWIMIYR